MNSGYFAVLSRMKITSYLKIVDISGLHINNTALKTLIKNHFHSLEYLDISNNKLISSFCFNHSFPLMKLHTLRASECSAFASQPNRRHFAALSLPASSVATQLHTLDISCTPFYDMSLAQLPEFTGLRDLNLQQSYITDASLPAVLQHCTKLEKLDISFTRISRFDCHQCKLVTDMT